MTDNEQMSSEQRNDEKHKIFRFMLQHEDSVLIHVDPRKKGVIVPTWLHSHSQVVLQVGLNMPVPIPDLCFDEEGVLGTLSFKGVPFTCFMPWSSIFALVRDDRKGKVWSDDMPAELLEEIKAKSLPTADVSETAKTNPYLRPVNKLAARAGWGVIDGGRSNLTETPSTGRDPFSA